MAGIHNKIVVVQRVWGTDAYIAFYDNGDAVMFTDLSDDSALQHFVQECSTAGCSKTIEFPIQVNAEQKIKCRQTLYCKAMTIGGNATTPAATASNIISSVTKGGINFVLWSPTFKRLTVQEGLLGNSKSISLTEVEKAPNTVFDFMQQCVDTGYALKRVYQTTVDNRMVTTVEYLFSVKKIPRDFRGPDTDRAPAKELQSMGFEI